MKIALLLTGFAHRYESSFMSIKQKILDQHDTDIYISSWDMIEDKYQPHDAYLLQYDSNGAPNPIMVDIDTNAIIQFYQPYLVKYKFNNYKEYHSNRFDNIKFLDRGNDIFLVNDDAKSRGSFWIERLRDQYYILSAGWDLIENKEQYDIFIRSRFDIHYWNFMIQQNNNVNVAKTEYQGLPISDFVAYGNLYNMNHYFKLFHHIENMYVNHNIDITNAEEMLHFYLTKYCHLSVSIDSGLIYTKLNKY